MQGLSLRRTPMPFARRLGWTLVAQSSWGLRYVSNPSPRVGLRLCADLDQLIFGCASPAESALLVNHSATSLRDCRPSLAKTW